MQSYYDDVPTRDEVIARLTSTGSQKRAAKSYEISIDKMVGWLRYLKITRRDYMTSRGGRNSQCPSRQDLIALRDTYKFKSEIAKVLKVDKHTVARWFKLHGVQGKEHTKLDKTDPPLIRELYSDHGVSINELSVKFNVAPRTIRDVVNYVSWKV